MSGSDWSACMPESLGRPRMASIVCFLMAELLVPSSVLISTVDRFTGAVE